MIHRRVRVRIHRRQLRHGLCPHRYPRRSPHSYGTGTQGVGTSECQQAGLGNGVTRLLRPELWRGAAEVCNPAHVTPPFTSALWEKLGRRTGSNRVNNQNYQC